MCVRKGESRTNSEGGARQKGSEWALSPIINGAHVGIFNCSEFPSEVKVNAG